MGSFGAFFLFLLLPEAASTRGAEKPAGKNAARDRWWQRQVAINRAISKNATAVSDDPDTLPVSDGPAPPVIVEPLTRHGRLCDPIACTTPALADKPPVAPARRLRYPRRPGESRPRV